MSGPAILKLSSYAARLLAEKEYKLPVSVRWTTARDSDIENILHETMRVHSSKQLPTFNPFGLPQRLWAFLMTRSLADRWEVRWHELGKKDVNRIVNVLCNDTYQISGRGTFKDEFVTCGGISLKSVNPSTLESKLVPRLFFAGEVLDVDGVTGGFNFQAAWTTAYTVASAIVSKLS